MLNIICQGQLNQRGLGRLYDIRMDTIGKRWASLRKQLGLTGEQLGEKLGLSKGTISQWETDLSIPRFEHAQKLRQLIEFSYDWLYEGKLSSAPYDLTPEAVEVAKEWQALEDDKRAAYKTLLDLDSKHEGAKEGLM